jgi:hypothetical protein
MRQAADIHSCNQIQNKGRFLLTVRLSPKQETQHNPIETGTNNESTDTARFV